MTDRPSTGERVVTLARRWIGTPYQHQASARGAGTDCLGLVRGVWRELFGSEPGPIPAYTPDWAEAGAEEVVLERAARYLLRVAPSERRPGDVLVFRMRRGVVAKHMGICAERDGRESFIHAYSGRSVCETLLGGYWERRIAAVFRFPLHD
ncbi:MAG: peptidase [Alphaproteobacteria bacterium]|nr:MAG: peptidase [Alphaproteobacteria bacterium]